MVKGCFDVQKRHFGERSMLFHRFSTAFSPLFYYKWMKIMLIRGKWKFFQYFHEIYRWTSLLAFIVKSSSRNSLDILQNQPISILFKVSEKQTTTSEIYLLEREKSSSAEMKIYFTELLLFWKDEISGEKHEEITMSNDSLFDNNPKVQELPLFSSNSLEDFVWKSKITGTLAEIEDISSVVHRLLSDLFVPTHRRRRMGLVRVQSRLSTLVRSH